MRRHRTAGALGHVCALAALGLGLGAGCGQAPGTAADGTSSAGSGAAAGGSAATAAPARAFDAGAALPAFDAAFIRAKDATSASDAALSRSGADAAGALTDAGSSCGGAAFCDSFEHGGGLDPALYEVVEQNCSGTGQATIDTSVAHGGSKSLKVLGSAGYCNHVFVRLKVASLPDPLYLRFFVRFASALGAGHVAFAAFHDLGEDKDLRFGGQNQVLIWNRESDDATLPELSPAGVALSVAPSAEVWHCVELMIGSSSPEIGTFVDGAAVTGLTADGVATPDIDSQWLRKAGWQPKLGDARIGFESYAGDSNTLWFDDLALGSARIGCGN